MLLSGDLCTLDSSYIQSRSYTPLGDEQETILPPGPRQRYSATKEGTEAKATCYREKDKKPLCPTRNFAMSNRRSSMMTEEGQKTFSSAGLSRG